MRTFPLVICVALLASTLNATAQGPLTPPGPPAPTMKTLEQVEARTPLSGPLPITISQPGSYYLTKDLQADPGKTGIVIAASDVNLDLNGYSLVGPSDGTTSDGIVLNAGVARLRVHNGKIRQWKGKGIGVGAINTTHCRYEDLQVADNSGDGIRAGTHTSVLRCAFSRNGGSGFFASDQAQIKDSSADANDDSGFRVGATSIITGCTATGNKAALQAGIKAESGSHVSSSVARNNTGAGIDVNTTSEVKDCVVYGVGTIGINAANGSMVKNCVVEVNIGNGKGIEVKTGSTVQECRVAGSSQVGTGIGIHMTGSRGRIEGNSVSTSGTGYRVDQGLNVIIRNISNANGTGYVFGAGNLIGTIVDTAAELNNATNSNANIETL